MKTPIPKPGSQVHLVIREFTAYQHARPNWVLDGTVIDPFWWEKDVPDAFAVLVPGDEVPLRSIRMRNVISINGTMVEGWEAPLSPSTQTWQVESNSQRDQFYTVTFDGRHWGCNCRGFKFHNHCSHVREVQSREEVHG